MWWRSRNRKDGEIVRRVLQGRRDEFGLLVERYLPAVQAVAYAHTGNRTDAQDIAQETFLTAYQRLHTLREVGSLGAWLTTIARNAANHLTRQRQRRGELLDLHGNPQPDADSTEPARQELLDLLHRQIQTLPEDHREVLLLHYFAGKKVREIAELQELSTDAVKKRLQRAREALSASMSEHVKDLLEPESERKKESTRIMGLVALSSPAWHITAEATVGGVAAASGGALAVKLSLGALALVFAGAVLWNVRPAPKTNPPQIESAGIASAPSASAVPATPAADESPVQPDSGNVQKTSGPRGAASGTVIDVATKEPVPNANLMFFGDEPLKAPQAHSDSEGRFRVENLPPAEYRIKAFTETMVLAGDPVRFTVREGTETSGLVVTMMRGGTVAGRVYDNDTGGGIAGVVVRANPNNPQPITSHWGESKPSAADGSYTVEGLPAGKYRVIRNETDGYPHVKAGEVHEVTVKLGEVVAGINFALDKGLSVSGMVLDNGGNAVHNAWVVANTEDYRYREGATTRLDGTFEIAGLSPTHTLRVQATSPIDENNKFESDVVGPIELLDAGVDGLVLELRHPQNRRLAGVVVGPDGKPVAGAGVLASPENFRHFGGNVTADDEGRFNIPGLAAGNYKIGLARPREESWKVEGNSPTYTIPVGHDLTGLRVIFDDLGTLSISGTIRDVNGTPLKSTLLEAAGEKGMVPAQHPSDANGRYQIDGLQVGEYRVTADHADYSRQEISAVMAGSTNADFVLEARGAIEGTVVDAQSGRPIPKFKIGTQTRVGSENDSYYLGSLDEDFGDETGAFRLARLHVAQNLLTVTAPGHKPEQLQIAVEPGKTTTGVVIRLEPGRVVHGMVVDAQGEPVGGALVYLGERLPHSSDLERMASARTPQEGHFTLDTVPGDTTCITVYHPDYAVQTVPLSGLPSEEISVVLDGGGSLAGLVRVGGAPVANADVALDYTGLPYPLTVNAVTAPDGRYEFLHTQAGEAMLRVTIYPERTGGATRSIARTITVQAGAPTDIDIDFAALDASLEGVITAHGVPAGEGWVALECGDAENPEYIRTRTDVNGAYVLESVPSGPASLIVAVNDGEQRRNKQMPLTIPSGTRSRWDVDFSGNAAIRALVQNAAAGVPVGIFVLPFAWEPPENATAAKLANFTGVETFAAQAVDSQGQCLFERMEAGTYTVVAVEGERISSETLELGADQSTDVTLTLP
ncbi:MAG: sigma-70 family RNA polymerase sigma factor [Candidatus Hydrogenedentes bacterium]|nr:sigma-70 family RNA polymerase sigma factor [Candidatus Hydrogenedentota bacterium]